MWIFLIILILIISGALTIPAIIQESQYNFNFDSYRQLLGKVESNNDYEAVNKSSGALGRYQFIPETLDYLRQKFSLDDWINANEFLHNHNLQDKYLQAFIKDNRDSIISKGLNVYLGETIKGRLLYPELTAKLNWYGLHAGSHLGGVTGLQRFLVSNIDADDRHAAISDYCVYFSSKLS